MDPVVFLLPSRAHVLCSCITKTYNKTNADVLANNPTTIIYYSHFIPNTG